MPDFIYSMHSNVIIHFPKYYYLCCGFASSDDTIHIFPTKEDAIEYNIDNDIEEPMLYEVENGIIKFLGYLPEFPIPSKAYYRVIGIKDKKETFNITIDDIPFDDNCSFNIFADLADNVEMDNGKETELENKIRNMNSNDFDEIQIQQVYTSYNTKGQIEEKTKFAITFSCKKNELNEYYLVFIPMLGIDTDIRYYSENLELDPYAEVRKVTFQNGVITSEKIERKNVHTLTRKRP